PVDGKILEDGGLVADAGGLEKAPDFLDLELAGQGFGDRCGVKCLTERLHPGGVVFLEQQADLRSEEGVWHSFVSGQWSGVSGQWSVASGQWPVTRRRRHGIAGH